MIHVRLVWVAAATVLLGACSATDSTSPPGPMGLTVIPIASTVNAAAPTVLAH